MPGARASLGPDCLLGKFLSFSEQLSSVNKLKSGTSSAAAWLTHSIRPLRGTRPLGLREGGCPVHIVVQLGHLEPVTKAG